MVLTSSSVTEEVVDVKRQQLVLLFSVWDTEACGRVRVRHVPSILRALFPTEEGTGALGMDAIRRAYERVTGLTWQQSRRDARLHGPTMNDLMEMIDLLGAAAAGSSATAQAGDGFAYLARQAVNAELQQLVAAVHKSETEKSSRTQPFTGEEGYTKREWQAVANLVDVSTVHNDEGDLVDRFFPVAL